MRFLPPALLLTRAVKGSDGWVGLLSRVHNACACKFWLEGSCVLCGEELIAAALTFEEGWSRACRESVPLLVMELASAKHCRVAVRDWYGLEAVLVKRMPELAKVVKCITVYGLD